MAFRNFLLFIVLPCALGWKPIPDPKIKLYKISQTYPAQGGVGGGGGVGVGNSGIGSGYQVAQSRATTTYHGNHFPSIVSRASTNLASDELETVGLGKNNGGYFANKLHNGFLSNAADNCPVEKYALNEEGVIQYNSVMPKLEQFTLCTWARFTNHSGDHTLFTYSLEKEPREIQFWIANANKQSFISMAIHGQSLYRLNYPLKLYKWHHFCSSWNGKTGEWQLWVKAERVGRGFHNRLVNHKIPGHGTSFSGGASFTGAVAQGHHVEITMLQLYKVALSAGKAHRDHKHHHVHHFDHNGPIETTKAPPTTAPPPAQPVNPLLANGQIAQRVPLNLAGAQQGPSEGTITSQFANGQLHTGSRFVQQQLLGGQIVSKAPTPFAFDGPTEATFDGFGSAENIRLEIDEYTTRRKRDSKKLGKRGLVMLKDGSIVDDSLIAIPNFFDGLTQFGGQEFKQEAVENTSGNTQNDLEDEIREHDREPAEGEVQAVMSLCSKCQVEPFQGAVVFAWRELQTITEHTLKALSTGPCGDF